MKYYQTVTAPPKTESRNDNVLTSLQFNNVVFLTSLMLVHACNYIGGPSSCILVVQMPDIS